MKLNMIMSELSLMNIKNICREKETGAIFSFTCTTIKIMIKCKSRNYYYRSYKTDNYRGCQKLYTQYIISYAPSVYDFCTV